MSLSPLEYIRHMIEEIDYILTRIPDTDYDSFLRDGTLKRAFVRSLEVIGEASKKLPENVKAMHPDIEWRKVSGMRDRLIHDYFGVDYTIVWDVAKNKLRSPCKASSLAHRNRITHRANKRFRQFGWKASDFEKYTNCI